MRSTGKKSRKNLSPLQQVASFISEHSLLVPGESVLVAVSGGADSLALLWLLHQLGYALHIAHINHGLRGVESDADEAFVSELASTLQLPITTRRIHLQGSGGKFSEDEARRKRYHALVEIAHVSACTAIATGHTANDNLETLLLHFARAATVEGWGGIPPVRVLALPNEENKSIRIVRPILPLTREQTQAICGEAGWNWREDSSNTSTIPARNLLRRELLPLLERIGGKNLATLAVQATRGATLRRDENALLDGLAQNHLHALQLRSAAGVTAFDGLRFGELHVALQRRVMRLAIKEVSLQSEISAEHIEAIRRHVVQKARRKVWQLPQGVSVEWTGAMSGNRIRVWHVESKTH